MFDLMMIFCSCCYCVQTLTYSNYICFSFASFLSSPPPSLLFIPNTAKFALLLNGCRSTWLASFSYTVPTVSLSFLHEYASKTIITLWYFDGVYSFPSNSSFLLCFQSFYLISLRIGIVDLCVEKMHSPQSKKKFTTFRHIQCFVHVK